MTSIIYLGIAYRGNKESGNHGNFKEYVHNDAYLYYFHLRLLECGSAEIKAKAVVELPEGLCTPSESVNQLIDLTADKKKEDEKGEGEGGDVARRVQKTVPGEYCGILCGEDGDSEES